MWQWLYGNEDLYLDEDSRERWQGKRRSLSFPQDETLFLFLLGSQGTRMHSADAMLPWDITASGTREASIKASRPSAQFIICDPQQCPPSFRSREYPRDQTQTITDIQSIPEAHWGQEEKRAGAQAVRGKPTGHMYRSVLQSDGILCFKESQLLHFGSMIHLKLIYGAVNPPYGFHISRVNQGEKY